MPGPGALPLLLGGVAGAAVRDAAEVVVARLGRLHAGDGLHVQTGELGLDSLPLGILQQLTMRVIGDTQTQFSSVVSESLMFLLT